MLPSDAAAVAAPAHRASVLIVDDHALLRTGVANIINQEPICMSSQRRPTAPKAWRRSRAIIRT